jgi:hypothetical protein
MIPHERSLVERLEGKPFVILGVNADEDKSEFRRLSEQEKISWRSWWDGGASGPIAQSWNVQGWPQVFILDHNGLIRYRGMNSPQEIDEAVDLLLREVEEKPTKP